MRLTLAIALLLTGCGRTITEPCDGRVVRADTLYTTTGTIAAIVVHCR